MAAVMRPCHLCNSSLPQNSPSSRWQADAPPPPRGSPLRLSIQRVTPRRTARPVPTGAKIPRRGPDAISSFAESGSMDEALHLFQGVRHPGTFLWNVMIRGYADSGCHREAVEFYCRMRALGVRADRFTYPLVIKSCRASMHVVEGWKIHGTLVKVGLDSDVFVSNSLIVMYAEFGEMVSAERVFDEMPHRDLVSWNSMMGGYVSGGVGGRCLCCLRELRGAFGLEPDRIGVITALQACSLENHCKQGKEIHCYALRRGYETDNRVQTSVLDMYCKCGNLLSAESLFNTVYPRNVITWNVLIDGYTFNGHPHRALSCLIQMQHDDSEPDTITLVNLLPSCAQLGYISQGKTIHGTALRKGFLPHVVLETSLVDMYAKCGELKSAEWLFSQMAGRTLVSWNSMINAYIESGKNLEAVELFLDLQQNCLEPDIYTTSLITSAIAALASVQYARQIHAYAVKSGYCSNTFILNSMIYMYAKCGYLQTSRRVFESMVFKDIVSWNTIIMACAIHGQGNAAIELFSRMLKNGSRPNKSTFVSILSACSISGLVDEGWMYFNLMQRDYGLDPEIEHYGCMVDLIGRTRNLYLARSFINRIPLAPTARIWGSLLSASRKNNSIEVAEAAAEQIFSLKHDNTGCYILLSNMYAYLRRWDDVEKVRCLMKKHGLQKATARSVVEHNGKAWSFVNGDKSHIESSMINEVLDILSVKIGDATHIPSTAFTLQEFIAKKKVLPCWHSVRSAVCFGLMSSAIGTPVLVKKNVRICDDCHLAIKLISKICRRDIIVGDSRIYHHFRDGLCCCGDYW